MSILTPSKTKIHINGCELVNVEHVLSQDYADNYCFTFTVEDQYRYILEEAIQEGVNQVDYQTMDPEIKPKADVLDRNRHFKVEQHFIKPYLSFEVEDSYDLEGKSVSIDLHLRDDKNGTVRLSCDYINLPDA